MRSVVLVAAGLTLAAATLLWLREGSDQSSGAVDTETRDAAAPDPTPPPALPDAVPAPPPPGEPGERRDAGLRRLRFLITLRGEPMPGAEVLLLPLDERTTPLVERAAGLPAHVAAEALRLTTDAEGWAAADLPRQDLILAARCPGSAPTADIIPGDVTEDVEFDLHEECVLTGTVRFADGRPAAGARVTGRKNVHLENLLRGWKLVPDRLPGMFFSSETVADADGKYALGGLRSGINLVEASFPGFAAATAPEVQVPWYPVHHFVLHAAAAVAGRVTDAQSGAPLEGVLVEGFSPSQRGPLVEQSAVSGPDGLYRLPAIHAGTPWIGLRTFAEGHAVHVVKIERLLAGEERRQDLLLERSAALEGRVMDTAGRPVQFASVRIQQQSTGLSCLELLTPEDGRFAVDALAAGEAYRLHVVRRGVEGLAEPVLLEGIQVPREPLDVILPAYGVVHGVVKSPDGDPRKGWVRLVVLDDRDEPHGERWSEIAAEDGAFTFENVPPGGHALTAFAEGFGAFAVDPVMVDPPHTDETPFDLEVGRGVAVTGRVTDRDSGEPLIGARVRFADTYPTSGCIRGLLPFHVATGGSGEYRLEGAPVDGSFALAVDGEGRALTFVRIPASAPASTLHLDVAVTPGATIRAWVADADGRPLADCRGYLGGANLFTDPVQGAETGGILTFERLGPGKLTVTVESHGDSTSLYPVLFQREIVLEAGERRDVFFEWPAGGTLRGTVTAPRHRGKARHFAVNAQPMESAVVEMRKTYAVGDQAYELHGLAPGRTRVWVRTIDSGPRLTSLRTIALEKDVPATLDFEFGAGRIHGRITRAAGEPLAGARFRAVALAAGDGTRTVEAGPEGDYDLLGLNRGGYEYIVVAPGHGRREGRVDLPDGDSAMRLDLALDPEAVFRVKAVERGGAQAAGASLSCTPTESPLRNAALETAGVDGDGFTLFPNASAGLYRILATSASGASGGDYFPAEEWRRVAPGESAEVVLTLRRRAALEIVVQSADGLAVAGAAVAIVDRESGGSLESWIARGWIAAPPQGLATDAAGELRIDGIPEGAYQIDVPGTTRVVEARAGAKAARAVLTAF